MFDDLELSGEDATTVLRGEGGVLEEPRKASLEKWKLWQQRIKGTWKHRRDHWNGDRSWQANYALHRGIHWMGQQDAVQDGVENVVDHMTIAKSTILAENLIAFLTKNDPYFPCSDKTERAANEKAGKKSEAVLNHFWQEHEFTKEGKKAVRDLVIAGHCIGRTDFWAASTLTKMKPKVDGGAAPTDTTQYHSYVRPEAPSFRRVNPFAFLIDPTTPTYDLAGARWVAEIFVRPLADIVSDENYDKKVRRKIELGILAPKKKADLYNNHEEILGGEDLVDEDQIILFEVWDKRFRQHMIFAMDVDEPLQAGEWPYPYLDDFPYFMENLIDLPNEVYGLGFFHLVAQPQQILDLLATKLHLTARRFTPKKYLENAEGIAPEEKKKIEDDNFAVVQLPGGAKVYPEQQPNQSFDFYQGLNYFEKAIDELSGQDALMRGGDLPSRTSAREIDTRNSIQGSKISDYQAAVDRFFLTAARQTLQHCRAGLSREIVARVAGRDGHDWVQVQDFNQIREEVDVRIESSSREIISPQVERQQAMELMNMVVQSFPQALQIMQMQQQSGVTMIDLRELYRYVFETFPDVNMDRIFPALGEEQAPIPEVPVPSQQAPLPAPTPAGGDEITQSLTQLPS